jgi:hypothetical protein
MARIPVPTLKGWEWEISEKADSLMAFYLTSDYSQSFIYKDRVASLQYQIAIDGKRPDILENNVKATLMKLFDKYFEKTEVSVNVSARDPDQPNSLDIKIEVFVYESNVKYSVGREIQAVDGKMNSIVNIINQ